MKARTMEDPLWPGFRLRGSDVTRLESFSDAVFGFALTLLVVSLDVPKTFADLTAAMRGFPAFAVCFLFLALIWNSHYRFCRRYGLHDGWTRFLTCLLLFVVLFYVYPLKFLFSLSITGMLFGGHVQGLVTLNEFRELMTIYGLGFAAVYVSLLFLYLRAYRLKNELELTPLERFDTRYQIWRLVVLIGVGLLAAAVAQITPVLRLSGFTYVLLYPFLFTARKIHSRLRMKYFPASAS